MNCKKYITYFLLMAFALLLPHSSFAIVDMKTDEFTLKNGLKVIVIENHKIPAVSQMIWYKVGASDEDWGKSGIAHYLEHMMFKKTDLFNEGEFTTLVANFGGKNNAFTTDDKTVYFINISRDFLDLAMLLESDRMRGLQLDEKMVETEKQVILEERNMRIDNDPGSVLSEQMAAALYHNHPYGRPLIGWRHEIEKLTLVELNDFYKKYYSPNNAILVIAGDITSDDVKPMVEKYYGNIEPSDIGVNPYRKARDITEPSHIAPIKIVLNDERAKAPEMGRYYLAPSAVAGKTEYALPLAVLAEVIGGGESSRFYRSLVLDKGLAVQTGLSYNELTLGDTIFGIYATPKDGVPLEKVEKAIDEEIKKLLKNGVKEEELAIAKNTIRADAIYARDGLQGMATVYGMATVIGLDKDYVDKWPDKIQAVTKEQVMEAAEYVLKPEKSVTGWLIPEKKKEK